MKNYFYYKCTFKKLQGTGKRRFEQLMINEEKQEHERIMNLFPY